MSDKVDCAAYFDETGVRFAETWCTEVGSLPLPIRAASWKRLAAPRSYSKFSGSTMVFGTSAAGAAYSILGAKLKP